MDTCSSRLLFILYINLAIHSVYLLSTAVIPFGEILMFLKSLLLSQAVFILLYKTL